MRTQSDKQCGSCRRRHGLGRVCGTVGGRAVGGEDGPVHVQEMVALPHVRQGVDEMVHQRRRVHWPRRDAQPLRPDRHRRVVDGLRVHTVLGQQLVRRPVTRMSAQPTTASEWAARALLRKRARAPLAQVGVVDEDWYNVRWIGQDGDAAAGEALLELARMLLLQLPLRHAVDARLSQSHATRTTTLTTHLVRKYRTAASAPATVPGGSDVVKMKPGAYERTMSTMRAVPATYPPMLPYAEPRSVSDGALLVCTWGCAPQDGPLARVPVIISTRCISPSRSATPAPVAPYMPTACTWQEGLRRVRKLGWCAASHTVAATYLVQKGQGAVLGREVTHLANRRNRATHRVHRLERDELGRRRVRLSQQLGRDRLGQHVCRTHHMVWASRVPAPGGRGRCGERLF
jgi:hypothetical protein